MGNVTMTMYRRNGGPKITMGTRSASPETTAAHLVEFEFGFGGHAQEITPTQATVATQIMNCFDTTVVSGTEEDMRIVVELCAYHSAVSHETRDAIISSAVDQMQQLGISMTPLNLTMFALRFMGENSMKAAMLMAFGLREPADVEAVLARNLRYKDLAAAFELVRDGCAVEDALALTA